MDNIIFEFLSKKVVIWWEKYFPAREIMKIAWYYKWERFYWVIQKTVTNEQNKDFIDKHFLFQTIKNTWGRPKENVYLTIEWCYSVLKNADTRKNEVITLLDYLKSEILNSTKIDNKKILSKYDYSKNLFILLGLLISFIAILWFLYKIWYFHWNDVLSQKETKKEMEDVILKDFSNFNKYIPWSVPEDIQQKLNEKYKDDIETQKLEEEKLKQIEETEKLKQDEELKKQQEESKKTSLEQIKNAYLYQIYDWFNLRSDFTRYLSGSELINNYFTFWNNKMFRDACSLLSKKWCITNNNFEWYSFIKQWEKVDNWYEILSIQEKDKEKGYYCVKYRYKLKNDLSDGYITETFNYVLIKVWDSYEISKRLCEKIEKDWRKIPCPFELNQYHCND